jgi:predicted peptidase
MKVEQHQGKSLPYLNIYPDDYNSELRYPLVVMLHGFGANMKDRPRQAKSYCWVSLKVAA